MMQQTLLARIISEVLNVQKPARRWEDMNPDCLAIIFEKAGTASLMFDIPFVCKSWYKASLNPKCWKTLDFASVMDESAFCNWFNNRIRNSFSDEFYIGLRQKIFPNLEMVEFAVCRSQGMATKVILGYKIHPNNVLPYIASGCPRLRSLIMPETKTSKTIPDLVKNWKDLEHLRMCNDLCFKDVLAEISTHCRKFVALTTDRSFTDSEQVWAIVTFLPKIKYLALPASELSRENLVIVLTGCRELETLDVRDCVGFDSNDAELLKLASHIKTFMCKGSTIDYADDMYGYSVCYGEYILH